MEHRRHHLALSREEMAVGAQGTHWRTKAPRSCHLGKAAFLVALEEEILQAGQTGKQERMAEGTAQQEGACLRPAGWAQSRRQRLRAGVEVDHRLFHRLRLWQDLLLSLRLYDHHHHELHRLLCRVLASSLLCAAEHENKLQRFEV
jgi:hypothetical protein